MTYRILSNEDNISGFSKIVNPIDYIYADVIYENLDFSWAELYWTKLRDNGILVVQTDYHTSAQWKLYLDALPKSNFVNWVIYKQEWGGVPRKGFPIKHDDILIYSKGEDFAWYGDKIQMAKATAGTAFDKKGTGLKTPCSVFDDLGNFSTMSKERLKNPLTGKNVQWQKPIKLLRRLMLPFLDEGDLVVDPFMGTATSGVVAQEMKCNYVGFENDENIFGIAKERLENSKIIQQKQLSFL
jgi:DNA modification methylase